jgi:aspartyl-tRNA synthetase
MSELKRFPCGDLREINVGETVRLNGWVNKRRDLGGLIFIDLRDRSGLVQIVFDPATSEDSLKIAEDIRNEFVLEVTGNVVLRNANTINSNISTGSIEIKVNNVVILNKAKTAPFSIHDSSEINEEVRLKYRYLDLRRPVMQETMKMRHSVTKNIRNFLDEFGCFEIETPILTKSTPEGARDYLVPSRVHDGKFYALPQSPQIFKQLLMVSGYEKYYQIARCFRDEDLRADRQPEFTQVDIETSFMSQDEILEMMENMMVKVMKEAKGLDIQTPFPRLTYSDAMGRFGSDKPDTRFGLELINLSEFAATCGFQVFKSAVESGGLVNAINVKGSAEKFSRKDIDGLTDFVKTYKAKGLAWMKVEDDGLKGPIAKFFEGESSSELISLTNAEVGDLLLFVADKKEIVQNSLGNLRNKLGKDLSLIDESKFNFLWIVEWPLLEYDEEQGRYFAAHHPFTMPYREDIQKLKVDPSSVRAQAYDLVLNGYELGGGSLRIYEKYVQEMMFSALGLKDEDVQKEFGFLLDAFEYGTPPHGGIALGLDRLVMLLAGRTNLRDTIAFPKTASATCLLTDAPNVVSDAQLEELKLQIKQVEKCCKD